MGGRWGGGCDLHSHFVTQLQHHDTSVGNRRVQDILGKPGPKSQPWFTNNLWSQINEAAQADEETHPCCHVQRIQINPPRPPPYFIYIKMSGMHFTNTRKGSRNIYLRCGRKGDGEAGGLPSLRSRPEAGRATGRRPCCCGTGTTSSADACRGAGCMLEVNRARAKKEVDLCWPIWRSYFCPNNRGFFVLVFFLKTGSTQSQWLGKIHQRALWCHSTFQAYCFFW